MKYNCTENNIHIEDSYQIEKHLFKYYLENIKKIYPDCKVFNRSMFSLQMEWAVHNFLYNLSIAPERTEDVDLNYPQKLWEKIGYTILGPLSWIFV